LATAAAPERESRLAALGRVLWEVETSLVDQPAALAPCSPLVAAHEAVQALLVAQIGAQFGLELDHDWLAPGLEKEIRGELRPVPTAPGGAVRFQVPPKALGAGLEVAAAAAGRCVVRARGPATCVERLLAVPVAAVVAMAGQEYYLGQLAWLEANRPVELQAPSAPVTTVAGRTATSEVSLRNWSPVDLKVTMVGTVPAAGWQVKVEPAQIEVAAASNATVAVQTTPPVTATPGEYEVQWTASYAGEAGAGVVAPLRLNVMEALTPLGVGPRPEVKPGGPARFRQRGRVAVFAQAGEAVEVEVRNLRVTHYLDSLAYRLFDPDQKLVASGSVAIDASRPVAVTAASTGAHILELQPGSGSAEIVVRNQGVAEFATKAEPLRLFCSPVMRWFYVPEDAKEFRLGAIDGGPDETARFVVTAPTGRVALDRDGNYAGSEIAIEVRSGEGGRVWCLSCTPRQDISFWLTGDVCPYLSASPEQVLAGRRSGGLGPATSD
jgi:hypothetical protein